MTFPNHLRYTKDHEWIDTKNNPSLIGITHHAQDQLGDVVFVDLPKVGRTLTQGEAFGVVESVKTVSDLYAPVAGVVKEVNEALKDHPEWVNQDPYGKGWMIKLESTDSKPHEKLLEAAAYEDLLK